MLLLAYGIILMHAVVPHHHHDCCGERGIVFEDELTCTCDEHAHEGCCHHDAEESHHPFDMCRLQDLLSHLVISTRDDKMLMVAPEAPALPMGLAALPASGCTLPLPALSPSADRDAEAVVALPLRWVGNHALRAPPCAAPLA